MRKTFIAVLTCLLVITIAVCAWFYGYFNRKNPDNIPSKALMVTYLEEKGENYASGKIQGYSLQALTYIWGEPDGELFGMYGKIWNVDEDTYFIVYFDSGSLATNVKLGIKD